MTTTTIPDFYHRYPMLQPFIGEAFGINGRPSFLLVGESHYLPNGATLHRDASAWYAGRAEPLNDEERGWINTSEIFEDAREEGFPNRAHSIWKNAIWEINEGYFRYPDYTRSAAHVASYNFFLRPAEEGCSLRVTPQDIQMANEAFAFHCQALKPSAVIILSRLAANHMEKMPDIPTVVTPHPGCSWWNRTSPRYNGLRGRDLLSGFLAQLAPCRQ